jgi:hypothetical protein
MAKSIVKDTAALAVKAALVEAKAKARAEAAAARARALEAAREAKAAAREAAEAARLQKAAAAVRPVQVSPATLRRHFARGLVIAAGLEPALTPTPPPPVLWSAGESRLLVHLGRATLRLGDAWIDAILPVECDELGMAPVTCTFLTTTADRPGGFVWAAEDRPRGPALVTELWGEALVALAWRALVEAARIVAAGAGTDPFERPYVPAAVLASPEALTVLPMPPHTFVTTGGSER